MKKREYLLSLFAFLFRGSFECLPRILVKQFVKAEKLTEEFPLPLLEFEITSTTPLRW